MTHFSSICCIVHVACHLLDLIYFLLCYRKEIESSKCAGLKEGQKLNYKIKVSKVIGSQKRISSHYQHMTFLYISSDWRCPSFWFLISNDHGLFHAQPVRNVKIVTFGISVPIDTLVLGCRTGIDTSSGDFDWPTSNDRNILHAHKNVQTVQTRTIRISTFFLTPYRFLQF